MIDHIHSAAPVLPPDRVGSGGPASVRTEAREDFQQAMARAENRVDFSRHARQRAEQRGIEVTPGLMDRLADSVERAEAKGASNILALDRSLAFIINVPHHRVITTISQEELKDNIFTNIDGAVIL